MRLVQLCANLNKYVLLIFLLKPEIPNIYVIFSLQLPPTALYVVCYIRVPMSMCVVVHCTICIFVCEPQTNVCAACVCMRTHIVIVPLGWKHGENKTAC